MFDDANANGIFDPDEGPYLNGPVTVNLYPASNPDGAPMASASTSPSADGSYTLPEVPPGEAAARSPSPRRIGATTTPGTATSTPPRAALP